MKEKNIAIYGAGEFGKYVKSILDLRKDIKFRMFIDNNAPTYNKTLIVDEKTFLRGYTEWVDCVWVAMTDKIGVEKVVSSLLHNGYKNIYIIDKNVFMAKLGLEGRVYSIDDIRPEINYVQFPVTEWCNLKCKSCAYHCNLVNEKTAIKLEEWEKDLKALKQKFFGIRYVTIIGGEPLWVANLDEYMYLAKLHFPNALIAVTTNGLYIPTLSTKVIRAIVDTGAYLRVSSYKPTLKIVDEILSFGNRYGIEIRMTNPMDEFELYLTKENKDYETAWKNCGMHDCYHVHKHRIYPCPIMAYRNENKDFLNLEITQEEINKNSEDIFGEKNGWEILAKLKYPFELCKYCDICHQYVKWELSAGNIDKNDWYVK